MDKSSEYIIKKGGRVTYSSTVRGTAIDIIDYVHGIGNTRAIRVAVKSGKIDKISQKMAKNDAFFKHFRQYRWNTSTYDL